MSTVSTIHLFHSLGSSSDEQHISAILTHTHTHTHSLAPQTSEQTKHNHCSAVNLETDENTTNDDCDKSPSFFFFSFALLTSQPRGISQGWSE